MFKRNRDKKDSKFVKRKKEKETKIPKVKKRYSTKRFKIGFVILVVFVSISGVLAFIRSVNIGNRVNVIKTDISKTDKNVEKLSSQNISYTPALEQFSNKVVDLYMNVPLDEKAQEQRIKDLKSVYASGLKEDNTPQKFERKLIDSTFLSLQRINGVNTAKYKVDYQVIGTTKVKKEVEEKYKEGNKEKKRKVLKDVDEKVTKDVTNVLCIPYVSKNGTLSVVATPYLQAYSESKANAKSLQINDDGTSVSSKKVDKFLKIFFEKYAESPKTDMQFLMANPESLNDTVTFDNFEAQVYKEGKGYKVYADIYFNENGTDFKRHEQMTLHLVKKDKTYFVKELVHNFE